MSVFTRVAPVRQTQSAATIRQAGVLEPASPAALLLLGEVLARLGNVERPVVQILAASTSGNATPVARDFAVAAATRFGRTLLVNASGSADQQDARTRGLSWLMSGTLGGEPDGISPDTSIPGLYYASLALHQPGPLEVPLEAWLAGPQAFRMVVVESAAIAADPRMLAVSSLCHGSVLAVGAGETTLVQLRGLARQLASAGVPVLGTLLHNAPRIVLKPWRRAG